MFNNINVVIEDLVIPAVILFGIPEHKDELGSGAYDPQGVVQKAIRAIKNKIPAVHMKMRP